MFTRKLFCFLLVFTATFVVAREAQAASSLIITTDNPPNGQVGLAYTTTLTATGGSSPYKWWVSNGSLPSGIKLSSNGALSGTPTKSGTYYMTFGVADSARSTQINYSAMQITVQSVVAPLAISTASLPGGTVGTAYSAALAAKGGRQPYKWSLASGSLPTGIGLSSAGKLSGTPTQSGTFSLAVKVVDSSSPVKTAQTSLTLVIQKAVSPLTISTTTLPAGTVGSAYSTSFAANGGTTPYTWSVSSGSLPTGLALSSTGVLSGMPTQSGTSSFVIKVIDSSSPAKTAQASLTLAIQKAVSPLAISTTTLSGGTVGSAYSTSFAANGGTTPYIWSLSSGSLPTGLTLSSSGVLSGTPTQSGTSSFVIKVTDSSAPAKTAQASFSLAIQKAISALTIATTSLSSGAVGSAYSTSFTANGGTTPYTWSVSSGSLPAGLTLSSAGVLSGTPTESGAFNFGVLVTDSSSTKQDASANYTLQINAAGSGTTWYIRPDGGTRYSDNKTSGLCNGKADAPYPGSGINQNCAFNDFRYLYTDGKNKAWVIAGGDTVIVRGGPWRLGQDAAGGDFGDNLGYGYLAYNPVIPAGTASRHTRILGENYATCSTSPKTQLFGGGGVYSVLYLIGAQYVDVQCFELTDHSQCQNCIYSVDDYAKNGLMTDLTTKNIWLQDLNIHGFTNNGIDGMIGGAVTVNNVRIANNSLAGWEFDDGSRSSSASAAVNASHLTVEWNGCNEEYPITHNYPAISCADDNSAGYGDGVGTPDTQLNFICDHCLFRYNTQDGLDLLHVSGSNITVTNSASYGNMGQQYKLGPMTNIVFQNNLAVTNCNRLSAPIGDISPNFNASLSDYCRANGDGITMAVQNGGTLNFVNNSIVGYSNVTLDIQCGGNSCSSSTLIFRNNLMRGYTNPKYNNGQQPAFAYFSSGVNFTQRDHNIIYNLKNSGCPSTGNANELCVDPKLANEPTSMSAEGTLDDFDFHLSPDSSAIGYGASLPGITLDYYGITRSNPPSVGAVEK